MNDIPVRPTFWNIPLWGEVGVYVLGLLAVAILLWGIVLNIRLWTKQRQPIVYPHDKTLRWAWVKSLFSQRKIRETSMGKVHFFLAWGFFLLFCGTALATIDWDIGHYAFGGQFLRGPIYLVYKFTLDIAGLAVLIALLLGTWRRYARPNDLPKDRRWLYGYLFLGVIILTGFFLEALRLAATQPAWSSASPVGHLLAKALLATGLSTASLETLHQNVWIGHGLISLFFVALIPVGIFAHLYRTPMNLFQRQGKALISIPKIDDIEEQETFGISKFSQFSTEDRLAFDACTECGRCNDVCPAVRAHTPLKPRELLGKLRQRMHGEGKDKMDDGDIADVVSRDELFSCTTCGACVRACPADIALPDMIVKMRRHLAMEEGTFPEGASQALENVASVGNPWGLDPYERLDWTKDLDVPLADPDVEVDILYWVGCAASYDKRAQKIARAMIGLLKASGVSFAIMPEERCHAEFARRLGEEYLFQTAAQENIDNLAQYKFKRILATCPHCFNTLANEYPDFEGFAYPVVAHSVWIKEMMDEGKLPQLTPQQASIVYHDPCYLARLNHITEQPRSLLEGLTDSLSYPQETGEKTFCCGAGGGQMWSETKTAKTVNVIRLKDLRATGANTIAVACPHCLNMLESARSVDKNASNMTVKDIAELVWENLQTHHTVSGDDQ